MACHAAFPSRSGLLRSAILDRSFHYSWIRLWHGLRNSIENWRWTRQAARFREHGFDGTSTDMLVRAMKIARQSLYDTFGDKWKLYGLAVERYSTEETNAHLAMLRGEPRAVDSIRAMMERVVEAAEQACLGIGSICEFGQSLPRPTAG
jgi:hypothetical protein